jgi:hypothetical protein
VACALQQRVGVEQVYDPGNSCSHAKGRWGIVSIPFGVKIPPSQIDHGRQSALAIGPRCHCCAITIVVTTLSATGRDLGPLPFPCFAPVRCDDPGTLSLWRDKTALPPCTPVGWSGRDPAPCVPVAPYNGSEQSIWGMKLCFSLGSSVRTSAARTLGRLITWSLGRMVHHMITTLLPSTMPSFVCCSLVRL